MSSGRILFLQGVSSAGKSTLASALQTSLDERWWRLEADDITRMEPTSERTGWWDWAKRLSVASGPSVISASGNRKYPCPERQGFKVQIPAFAGKNLDYVPLLAREGGGLPF